MPTRSLTLRRLGMWQSSSSAGLPLPNPLTRTLVLLALSATFLVQAYVAGLHRTPFRETTLWPTVKFLRAQQDDDSWTPMLLAYQHVVPPERTPLYAARFYEADRKFHYAPSSLLVFWLLHLPPVHHLLASLSASPVKAVGTLSWLAVVILAFFTVRIFFFSSRRSVETHASRPGAVELAIQGVVLSALVFTFYPLMKGFALGQIQTWISSALAILIWCWMTDRKTVGGVMAGLICLIKPQYSLLIVWALLRKEKAFLKGFVPTLLAGTLAATLAFGIQDHLDYLGVLSFISLRGESFYPNQSVNGTLNRFFFNGSNLIIPPQFPDFHIGVYLGTMVTSLLIVGSALFLPARFGRKGTVTDLCLIMLSATIASPVAWEHHYGLLLPIYAFLIPRVVYSRPAGGWMLLSLCGSYILTSNYFDVAKLLASTRWNFLQSYLLFGALIVLAILHVVSRQERPVAINAGATPSGWPRLIPPTVSTWRHSLARLLLLNPLTRTLILLTLTATLLVYASLAVIQPTSLQQTSFYPSLKFLRGEQIDDSWPPMLRAYQHLESDAPGSAYTVTFFSEGRPKFQYPPSSLLIFWALHVEPVKYLLDTVGMSPVAVGKAVSKALVLVMAFFVIKIFLLTSRMYGDLHSTNTRTIDAYMQGAFLVCLVLTFYPLMKGFALGQIQTWISCGLAAIVWCWLKDKKGSAGMLAGAISLIKPQYAVLILWGLFRREWSFVRASLFTIVAGLFASILAFGIEDHLNYLGVLSFLFQHGESTYTNQSFNGVLHRLLFNGSNLKVGPGLPDFNILVYIGTLVTSTLIIGSALFLPPRFHQNGRALDLCLIMLSSTIASPIAWEHHYGVLLPIYAFLIPYIVFNWASHKWMTLSLFGSYVLVSNYFDSTRQLAESHWNILQSYLLLGALIVLVSLYILMRQEPRSARATTV